MASVGGFFRGTARVISSGLPLAGYLPAISNGKYQPPQILWPPIGSVVVYAAGLATALIWGIGELPKLSKGKAMPRRWYLGGLVTTIVSLSLYAFLLISYVKGVETPFDGMQYRAVGSTRTSSADRCTPNKTDEDLLRCGGLDDGDIEKLWTPSSVRVVRLSLFASYVLALGSVNIMFTSKPRSQHANRKKIAAA